MCTINGMTFRAQLCMLNKRLNFGKNVFYYILLITNMFGSYLRPSSGCLKEY